MKRIISIICGLIFMASITCASSWHPTVRQYLDSLVDGNSVYVAEDRYISDDPSNFEIDVSSSINVAGTVTATTLANTGDFTTSSMTVTNTATVGTLTDSTASLTNGAITGLLNITTSSGTVTNQMNTGSIINTGDLTVGESGSSTDIILYDVSWSTQTYKIEVISGVLTTTKL
jgi:hypothetical protein